MILGYCRVSSAEQIKGTSLDSQEHVIRGYAQMKGCTKFDLQMFRDAGVSGAVPIRLRADGRRLIDTARKGDTIVATKLDRMFRNSIDALNTAEDLKQAGVNLVLLDLGMDSITSDGVSKFIFTIFAALSNMERDRIRERTDEGRKAKRERGGAIGATPFGYRKVGAGRDARLEVDESEQAIIAKAKELAPENSLRGISLQLGRAGFVSRTGQPFTPKAISRMIGESACH